MKNKKVAIIGTAGLPARYAGFETLAAHMVETLGNNWDFSVYCAAGQYKRSERVKSYKGARLIYLPFRADGLQSLLYDTFSILHALFYADVLFVMGVSSAFIIPFIRLFTNKKVVTSVDGCEWKRTHHSKLAALYRQAAEWVARKCAHANIENKESMQDFAALRHHVMTRHNGQSIAAGQTKYAFMDRPYAFKLCRIAPENNIEMILQAFVQAPQHQLVIMGNWNKSEYGRALRKTYAACPNIFMLDTIRNQQELDLLSRNSFAYIHGNMPGGLDPVLLEAMFMGLPVLSLATKNNQLTTEGKALYFESAQELAALINHTRIGQFRATGLALQEVAQRRYTWQLVATKYEYLFNRILDKRTAVEQPVNGKAPAKQLRFGMGF